MSTERLTHLLEATREVAVGVRHLDLSERLSEHVDERMLALARQIGSTSTGEFFDTVSEEFLSAVPRPDAVDHHAAHLPPNPHSTADQLAVLGIVDAMQGDQVPLVTERFAEFAREEKLFERVLDGETFVFPSNHLALPDQGFTLGYLHKAAHEVSDVERLEHHVTVMVGRLLGYYEVGGLNVIDGILRKAAGVLKTFPVAGGEIMDEGRIDEGDLDLVLRLFRKICNHQTKQAFDRLVHSSTGHVVLLAGGGSHDTVHPDGSVEMHPFGRTTREMLAAPDDLTVVPLFVDYGPEASLVSFGEPRRIDEPDDLHAVGREIARLGNEERARARASRPGIERFSGEIRYPEV